MILCLYGSGGLGRELYDVANRRNAVSKRWSDIIFVDDIRDAGPCFGTRSVKFDTLQESPSDFECIIAIGEPSARERLAEKIRGAGVAHAAALVDPSAMISPTATLGAGVVVCEFATIHTGVVIGEGALIHPYAAVGHDIRVGDFSVLSSFCAPGGGTRFGRRAFVGMHASILEKLTIGDDAVVSMGAAVFRDVPDGATVVGNPARISRGNDQHTVFGTRSETVKP